MVRFFLSGTFNFHLSRRSGLYDSYGRDGHPKYDVVLAQPQLGLKEKITVIYVVKNSSLFLQMIL